MGISWCISTMPTTKRWNRSATGVNSCKWDATRSAVSLILSASSRCPSRRFPKPLGSPKSKRATSSTSSTSPKTKSTWDPCLPSTTTCLKSCRPTDVRRSKSDTRSSETTKSSLISKNNWWPTANRMSPYLKKGV